MQPALGEAASQQRLQFRLPFCALWTRVKFRRRGRLRAPSQGTTQPSCLVPDYEIARKSTAEAVADGSRFPWLDRFEINRDIVIDAETLIATLEPLMTAERLQRVEAVCSRRTFNVLPILERPVDWGNVAAVCRSADAMGFGALHIVRDLRDERYKQSARTSGGADKWLDVQLFDDTRECLARAKALGYQVVAAHARADAVPISEVEWARPTAFVLGSELRGVSEAALEAADACVSIPMDGFVESYNVSVAAALVLWEARRVRQERLGRHGDLTPEERHVLKAVMLLRCKGLARQYVTNLLQRRPPQWQVHRNRGIWGSKEFTTAGGEPVALDAKACHYWDGYCCWGEEVLFPGERCRYHPAHSPGFSTLNRVKLRQRCEALGLPLPDVDAAPHVRAAAEQDGLAGALAALSKTARGA